MSVAKARIVQRGLSSVDEEVWLNDQRVPALKSYRVEADYGDVRRIVLTVLVDRIDIVHPDDPPSKAAPDARA